MRTTFHSILKIRTNCTPTRNIKGAQHTTKRRRRDPPQVKQVKKCKQLQKQHRIHGSRGERKTGEGKATNEE